MLDTMPAVVLAGSAPTSRADHDMVANRADVRPK